MARNQWGFDHLECNRVNRQSKNQRCPRHPRTRILWWAGTEVFKINKNKQATTIFNYTVNQNLKCFFLFFFLIFLNFGFYRSLRLFHSSGVESIWQVGKLELTGWQTGEPTENHPIINQQKYLACPSGVGQTSERASDYEWALLKN